MSPLVSILISLVAYQIGVFIYRKTKITLLNPLLLGIIFVISILVIFDIPLNEYNKGTEIITFFLAPATVVLAVPLYNQIETLKKNIVPILFGITVGSTSAILSVIFLSKLVNLEKDVLISILPKSITTAIGIEITKALNADTALTIVAIVSTGIVGAAIGPTICKWSKIDNSIAKGVAIGTASHAVGTSKAIEIGEVEGAMSGLAIGIAGIITVFLIPILINFI
ncbi:MULTISPECIES: LrgB family protein [unclassified Cetobacterium]|uniref:LrgB family protein n=1 Tax=unclassified Cetobacterium TaxID=2630983 RepID=UPI00211616FC|nr:LrgB family protein [Cetobacterium sp. NK01]MCQ8213294.1 LrgB family protein [Cetobacterium sp. NK01]